MVLDRIYRMGRIGGGVPLVPLVPVVPFLRPSPLPPARGTVCRSSVGKMQALRDALPKILPSPLGGNPSILAGLPFRGFGNGTRGFFHSPSFFIPPGRNRRCLAPPFCRRVRDVGCRLAGTVMPLRRNGDAVAPERRCGFLETPSLLSWGINADGWQKAFCSFRLSRS